MLDGDGRGRKAGGGHGWVRRRFCGIRYGAYAEGEMVVSTTALGFSGWPGLNILRVGSFECGGDVVTIELNARRRSCESPPFIRSHAGIELSNGAGVRTGLRYARGACAQSKRLWFHPSFIAGQVRSALARFLRRLECQDYFQRRWEVPYLSRRNRVHLPLPIDVWLDEALQGSGITCIAIKPADLH